MSEYHFSSNTQSSKQEPEHNLSMIGRKLLEISGVKQVDSFDNEEFLLETVMGYMVIKGKNLQMKNLDVEKGVVSIKGKIHEIIYVNEQQGDKTKGFFSKIFK